MYVCVYIYIYIYIMRGWRNTVEVVLFEISNSMKPYPCVLHAYTSKLRPVTGFLSQINSRRFLSVFREPRKKGAELMKSVRYVRKGRARATIVEHLSITRVKTFESVHACIFNPCSGVFLTYRIADLATTVWFR